MRYSFSKKLAVMMAVITVIPFSAFADSDSRTPVADGGKPVIRDVELQKDGIAHGRVLDAQGRPAAGTAVELHTQAGVHKIVTDERGQFAVAGLAGGSCVVKVGRNSFGCRLWANGTAPPKSLASFVVVNSDNVVVRGQNTGNQLNSLTGLSNGQLLGLGLVAGGVVAIVLAAQDDDDENASD